MVARELAMATVFEAHFGGFEGIKRLECGTSWVQYEDEVKTKVNSYPEKSFGSLDLPFKRN